MADVGGRAHEQETWLGVRRDVESVLNQCWLKIERDEKFIYLPQSLLNSFYSFLLYAAHCIDINQACSSP